MMKNKCIDSSMPYPIRWWETGELVTASMLNEMVRDDFTMEGKNHRCNYCGGNTTDDRRGNCSACGAPRHENTESENGYFRLAF